MRVKKKKLTNRQIAIRVLWISLVGVIVTAIPVGFLLWDKIFGTVEKHQKEESSLHDSQLIVSDNETSSRVDTANQEIPGAEKPKDNSWKPSSVLAPSKETTVKKTEYKLNDTCLIIYLEGDSIAKKEAEALHDFLSYNKRKSLFQEYAINYYRLKPTNDTNWFLAHKLLSTEKGGTNPSARVFYSEQLNGLRLYLAATEGLIGVVFKEKYTAPGQYNQDETNRGHGVFKGFLITEFSPVLLDRSDKRLSSYDFVIVIPPYYLNTPTIDSIMESCHPPVK